MAHIEDIQKTEDKTENHTFKENNRISLGQCKIQEFLDTIKRQKSTNYGCRGRIIS